MVRSFVVLQAGALIKEFQRPPLFRWKTGDETVAHRRRVALYVVPVACVARLCVAEHFWTANRRVDEA